MTLADGTFKKIQDLNKGDKLQSISGPPAEVVCLNQLYCFPKNIDLVHLPGLKITPYHPIRINKKWNFPINLNYPVVNVSCDALYNLVLDQSHVIMIGDFECVTLGHGFVDDDVVKHPYFGSQLVINDLQRMPGWNNGFVEQSNSSVIRHPDSGLIVGFQQKLSIPNSSENQKKIKN